MSEPRPDNRHALIIGGAGYVGNVLLRSMLASGYRVTVLDRLMFDHQGSTLSGLIEDPAFRFIRGDLCDESAVEAALEGVSDVVLLASLVGDPIAGKYPDLARRVSDGCKRVLELADASDAERFVFTSTCSNYGLRESNEPATEEAELAPVSLYAELKVEFEQFLLGRSWRVCPTVLRIATAYGLSQRMRFDLTISEFTRTLAIGEELVVYDADTWRPYCHVDDISRAIMTVLDSERELVESEVFNVGHSDENYTKRMVVEAVLEALEGNGEVKFEEGGRDPRNYRVSFDKIRERLGYEPQRRVPENVRSLIAAIGAGVFDDVEERGSFYANHSVVIPGEPLPGGDSD